MIEEYAFSLSYPNTNGEEVAMNLSRTGSTKNSATFKSNAAGVTPDQMRSSACKMIRTLVSLMRTLDQMPEERTILMKLLYYDDVTPEAYQPPLLECCADDEDINTWNENPMKMEVGNVNRKHLVLALKVKSVLDPFSHNEFDQDNFFDKQVLSSALDHYIVPPSENTQDAAHKKDLTAQVSVCMTELKGLLKSNKPSVPKLDGYLLCISKTELVFLLDSGASRHMCHRESCMSNMHAVREKDRIDIYTAGGDKITPKLAGDVIHNGVRLSEVLYVPGISFNVISIGQLDIDGNIMTYIGESRFKILYVEDCCAVGEGRLNYRLNEYTVTNINYLLPTDKENASIEAKEKDEVEENVPDESLWIVDSLCARHMVCTQDLLVDIVHDDKQTFQTAKGTMISTMKGLPLSMDDSNALILPCKRKNKAQGKDKDGKKGNNKVDPKMSKSKLKKLQKLEEEKQKKLLQAKSIKILRKHKISDDAYSLLHASGTIGQADTLKEKRRRAVEFSKVGLDVPDDLSLFKKNGDKEVSENGEAAMEVCPVKFVEPAKIEDPGRECKNNIENDSVKPMECQLIMGVGVSIPEPKTEETNDDADMLANQTIQSSIPSCSGAEIDLQDKEPGQGEASVQEFFNPPIVVSVSRPHEVEKARRDLPIIMMEQEIMEAIYENSVVILCGETGCGKTTQVPQFLYEAGFGTSNRADRKGIIGITQPRRVAVLATARRVSYELGLKLGKEVGFQVRHDKMVGSKCSIKFMTDGILLREVQSDFLLKRYSVIILDEAHERSLNTDILIGMLSRIIKIRKTMYSEQQEKIHSGLNINPENMISQLKVVLMSATLQLKDFISNRRLFDVIPPAVKVPVRQFPVTVHFSKRTHDDYLGQAYKKVLSIHKKLPPGGILVFVTGQREVDYLCKKLQRASKQQADKKLEKVEDENGLSPEVVEKEICEAYDIDRNEPEHQDDMFSSYGEDEINAGLNVDSSDIETESEMDTDSDDEGSVGYETKEEDGPVLAFLKGVESSSVLKASFKAISRISGEPESVEKSSDAISAEKSSPVPCFSKCTEPMSVSHAKLRVLPLYAMLPASQQLRVFQDIPEGERLVVVATNVAETSLTIPGIKYVVDTGKEKVKNYDHATGMASYEVQWISKASASQRAGRAGRTGPGHCYRLYSAAAFGKDDLFPEFSEPEIKKIPVDGIVLMLKFMAIDKVANFPFPTSPNKESLVEAERCLKALEAIDRQGRLTTMGKAMAQYPMSPRHSRLLLTIIKILKNQQCFARSNFILGYAAAAASALSFSNPFLMQSNTSSESNEDNRDPEDKDRQERKRQKKLKAIVRGAQAKFSNPSSDALTISRALQLFELSENPVEFCSVYSLHLKTMEEMSKLRKQLLRLIFHHSKFCEEFAWNFGGSEDVEQAWRSEYDKKPMQLNEEELLGQGICAGWADRVAKRIRAFSGSSKDDRKVRAVHYQSCAFNDTVYLHRSSSVAQIAPDFVVYSELLNTKRPYMHGVTSVNPGWLLKYASSLCTFSAPLEDPKPYYDPQNDQVYCYVSPIFSRHNWQLPLHSLPIKDVTSRLQVFACALLEGDVLPCLRVVQKFLALSPSVILGPVTQRRVGDLLNRMKIGPKLIDSRAALRDAWNIDPDFLYPEIKGWLQDKFHSQFGAIWEQMHQEVLLEGYKLFPKRFKKVKG